MISNNNNINVYAKAALCRAFELECERRIKSGHIKCPTYLSTGQEYVPAIIAYWCKQNELLPQVFVQHRAHSVYLSFGGDIDSLILELLGRKDGCAGGMGGSNCPQLRGPIRIYGHDALLATQVPISVGACYGNRKFTICFMGDAAAEEDYTLSSLGWAATHKLPIMFVVEDNDLSILTKVSVRRSWSMCDVARAFGLIGINTGDDIGLLDRLPEPAHMLLPIFINVKTTRLRWHSGAGTDDENLFDRHKYNAKRIFGEDKVLELDQAAESFVREAWKRHCEP